MGFLFTLKWSLVVKAPDLSSAKCLVVTDIFYYFFFLMLNLPFLYYYFFFPFELGYLLLPSAVHLHPLRSPGPAGLNPLFAGGTAVNGFGCFFFDFLGGVLGFFSSGFLGAGWRQRVGGSTRGVTEPNSGMPHRSAPRHREHPAPPRPWDGCTRRCCCRRRPPQYDFRLFQQKRK